MLPQSRSMRWWLIWVIVASMCCGLNLSGYAQSQLNADSVKTLISEEQQKLFARLGKSPRVTIRQGWVDGQLETAIATEYERTGPDTFATAVRDTIQTWEKDSLLSDGYMLYTVYAPNGRAKGFIRLDLNDAQLKKSEEKTRARIEEIAPGFDVQLASAESTWRDILVTNLRGFKWAFLGAGVIWSVFLAINFVRAFAPVAPPRKPDGQEILIREEKHALLEKHFRCAPAAEVHELWTRAMDYSNLDQPLLKKLEVNSEQIEQAKTKIEESQNLDKLLGASSENGDEDSEAVSTIVKKLPEIQLVYQEAVAHKGQNGNGAANQSINAGDKVVNYLDHLIEVNNETDEKDRLRGIWQHICETDIRKASAICDSMRGPRGLLARLDAILNKITRWFAHLVRKNVNSGRATEGYSYPLFRIYQAGLQNHLINRNHWWASQEIDRAIDRMSSIEADERTRSLDWLWAFAGIFPMLGLLGTVWGISRAFGEIQGKPPQELMTALASEINLALSTTIVGLILGLIAVVCYYGIKTKMDHVADSIDRYFIELTNKI